MMGGVSPEEWKERVGSQLQRARKARNWSIRRAAREAGVDDATWRHLEEGVRTSRSGEKVGASPRDDTLASVARSVGLDPAAVFEAAGREFVPPPAGEERSIDERIAALEAQMGVTPRRDDRSLEERLAELERRHAEGRSSTR
jgi:transcriptional regulator with XRE-family HTH domain